MYVPRYVHAVCYTWLVIVGPPFSLQTLTDLLNPANRDLKVREDSQVSMVVTLVGAHVLEIEI